MKYQVQTENGKQILIPVEEGQGSLSRVNGNAGAKKAPLDGALLEIVRHTAADANQLMNAAAEVAKLNIPIHVIDDIEIINED